MEKCLELLCEECPLNTNEESAVFRLEYFRKGIKNNVSDHKTHLMFILSGSIKVSDESIGIHHYEEQNVLLLLQQSKYEIEAIKDCEALCLDYAGAFQSCDLIRMDRMKRANRSASYSFHALPMLPILQQFTTSVINYLRTYSGCMYMHNAKQMELFAIFRFFYDPQTIFAFFFPIFDKKAGFESVVRTNLPQAKNAEHLAKLCGYKLSTFKKLFDRYFNNTPYQWMLQQNQQRIKEMLRDETLPIKVIVSEFGFTDQSHLNIYCKKYWGKTAKQIRTIMANKGY